MSKDSLPILIILDKWFPEIVEDLSTLKPSAKVNVLLLNGELPKSVSKNIQFLTVAYNTSLLIEHSLIILRTQDQQFNKAVLVDADTSKIEVLVADRLNSETHQRDQRQKRRLNNLAFISLFGLFCMFIGHFVFTHFPPAELWEALKNATIEDNAFLWMLAAGFVAQLIDGMLGMGYGVMSTTILLSTGLNPAAISGSIHTAEMFSSGASGFSHYKFGNINKKLFKTLLIPGILGAIVGAVLLVYLGEAYGDWIRPILSVYTLLLGIRIFYNAFKKNKAVKKVKNAGWLAGAGGFLDSFGGGGWGPLVTSTLIAKGKTPRYVIGTVSLTEFFVTLGSALTFFLFLGASHVQTILGLIVGGLIAAPLAARLAGKLPLKTMMISVGALVIISSLRTLIKFLT